MDVMQEIRVELARIADETGLRVTDLEKKFSGEIDRIAAVLRRSASTCTGGDAPILKTDADRAFVLWMRKGIEALSPDQHKSLTVGSDPSGGYLAPSFLSAQVEQYIRELSLIVQRARQVTFSQGEMDLPRVTSGTMATWVGELETRPETGLTVGLTTLVRGELACYVDVSQRLLEDSAISIEDLLAEDLGAAFASALTAAVLVGNGVKKPVGLLTDAAPDLVRVPSGGASSITPDALIDMTMAIAAQLLLEPLWLMNRKTAAVVRKMKGVANDHYLWQPSLALGQPATLLGYPVLTDENMPDIGAGSWPVLFGSFRRGLAVGGKPGASGVTILRDPYTLGTAGQVRFHARKRAGAVVYQGKAFAKMQVASI